MADKINDNPYWIETKKEKTTLKRVAKSVTLGLLEALSNLGEGLAEMAFDRKAAYRILYGYTGPCAKSKMSKYLYQLKKSGYLQSENNKKTGQESYKFTNKAKLKILDKISQGLKIDGKNRFLSYDIPEKMRDERDMFRRAIKQLGFIQIQKSLWVTNRNVGDFVEMAAYEFGVEQYVVYIVSEKTDIDGIIQKKFHSVI